MKRISAIFLFAIMIGTCLGQGTIQWVIPITSLIAQTNTTQYSPLFGDFPPVGGAVGNTAQASSGLVYYYELLYNTAFTGSQAPVPDYATLFGGTWLDTGLTATNSSVAGRIQMINYSTAATVPWSRGTTNNIMLVGWSANLGTDWLTVSNILANWYNGGVGTTMEVAYFGESATGYINPGTDNPGVSIFGSYPVANVGLPIYNPSTSPMNLYILPVPEPGTLSLACLGGFSLLLLRRRRK
jgi:hypothetical protein